MDSRIVLVFLVVLAAVFMVDARRQSAGCVFNGRRYRLGERWKDRCSAVCTCRGSNSFGCVSMCPPMRVRPPCRMVENPRKNPRTSRNCCPVPYCP